MASKGTWLSSATMSDSLRLMVSASSSPSESTRTQVVSEPDGIESVDTLIYDSHNRFIDFLFKDAKLGPSIAFPYI